MSFRRVLLADVAAPSPVQRGGVVRRVHVQGLCVWRESLGAQLLRLEIDDGTSVALLQVRGEAAAAELQEAVPGKMIQALGDMEEAPVFASGRSWKRWIDASSVSIVDDPNAESLHILETLLLQKTVYRAELQPPTTQTFQACSIPLLPIPIGASQPVVGEKRKLPAAVVPSTAPTPPRPSQRQPPSPVVVDVNKAQRSLLHQPSPPASIQPAEYQFNVSGADLKLIGTGAKTLEMRLNNPPYSIIRVNDRIKFNGRIVTTVTAVRKYAQLRSALEMEAVSSLLPPATAGAPGVSLNGAVRRVRQYISEAEEAAHGVAVFEFQAPPSASSAPRTPEEWTKLIFEFVGTKGGAGCTLRDLQFAFPALPVDKIKAMLTDLQMDAVIYLSNGIYRSI